MDSSSIWNFKDNTNTTFANQKIGIGILIRNSLGIPFWLKLSLGMEGFSMDYAEGLGVIESYASGLSLSDKLIVESDSLLAVRSLTNCSIDIYELGTLAVVFLSKIDRNSSSFSHVKRGDNIATHFLARIAF